VSAVVLGGSRARGTARPESDIDIGLYYREVSPFSIQDIRALAAQIAIEGSKPVVTELYGWGPWVNGGAWIQTPDGEVDFIYRNLDQVELVIEEGRNGIWHHDFDQQPPYGFRSIIYFGETSICVPLHDPKGEVARLKQSVAEYPEPLRSRIVQETLWGAEFSLWYCRTFASNDIYTAAGCMTRTAQYLAQALFALNKEYFVNDKHAMKQAGHFALRPRDFSSRLASALSSSGASPAEVLRTCESLQTLWRETVALTEGKYQSRFDL
jgi:hypothetical protein